MSAFVFEPGADQESMMESQTALNALAPMVATVAMTKNRVRGGRMLAKLGDKKVEEATKVLRYPSPLDPPPLRTP